MIQGGRLLLISPQAIAPMTHGAALRVANLAGRLSQRFEVLVFVPDSAEQARQVARDKGWPLTVVSPGTGEAAAARSHRLAPSKLAGKVRHALARQRWRDNPFGHRYGPLYPWLNILAREMERFRPDVVVMEHVWPVDTFRLLRSRRPDALYLVDCHNVESLGLSRYVAAHTGDPGEATWRRQLERVRRLESRLSEVVDGYWACSQFDLAKLSAMNPGLAGTVVPNGVDPAHFLFHADGDKRQRQELVFTGVLDYRPTRDGLLFFHDAVWPRLKAKLPALRLSIVGRNAPEEIHRLAERDSSVAVISPAADVRPYLWQASVGICPLFVASGTRLKILEAMSAGTPVVATSVGAEGLEVEDGVHLRIADTAEAFAAAILHLLSDGDLYRTVQRRARTLAEERYGWDAIARDAAAWLQARLDQHNRRRSRAGP